VSALFHRSVAVTFGTRRVTGLRVQFKVQKSLVPEPNTVDVSITNLAADTRAAMQAKGTKLLLEAGYLDATEVLFYGDVRTISHVRQGPDWISRFQCGDGEAAIAGSRVNESHAPGAKVSDVVTGLAKGMGVGLGNALDEVKKGNFRGGLDEFVNGVTLSGKTSSALSQTLKSAGLEWSIQDGQLQLLRPGTATTEDVVVLGPRTGLIGSPEFGEKKHLKAKTLLVPGLRPGRRVEIVSATATGLFRVEKVVHTGDTAGQDWYSECELGRL
jgi:hypothetical protein